jgi:xanthine dehydrogenase large subunit
MLAMSVREAIRDAIAAFGAGGPVMLESPATPERVFFAVQRARAEREAQVSSVGATL